MARAKAAGVGSLDLGVDKRGWSGLSQTKPLILSCFGAGLHITEVDSKARVFVTGVIAALALAALVVLVAILLAVLPPALGSLAVAVVIVIACIIKVFGFILGYLHFAVAPLKGDAVREIQQYTCSLM